MMRRCTTYLMADGCGCFDSTMELPVPESQPPRRWLKSWGSAKANLHGSGFWTECPGCNRNSRGRLRANRSGTCRRSAFAALPSRASDGRCCRLRPGLLIRCCQPVLLLRCWVSKDLRGSSKRLAIRVSFRGNCKAMHSKLNGELLAASRLIGALYATMGNFPAFTAVSLLYFAAVSFAETAHRLGKPELARGIPFASGIRSLGRRRGCCSNERTNWMGLTDTRAFTEEVLRVIEPFNLGRFGDPALQ